MFIVKKIYSQKYKSMRKIPLKQIKQKLYLVNQNLNSNIMFWYVINFYIKMNLPL